MDDSNVAIRLKVFIDSQALSHSQFADVCGIPRPSLSQILSGRNKKISDVIAGQIHKAFPDLSILWLLFGEGPMMVSSGNAVSEPSDESKAGNENVASGSNSAGFLRSAEASSGISDSVDEELAGLFGMSGSLFPLDDNLNENVSSPQAAKSSPDGKNPAVVSKIVGNDSDADFQANLRALKLRLEGFKRLENELVEYKNKVDSLQSQIENLRLNPRKVSHITVYYDDSTFETFLPKA